MDNTIFCWWTGENEISSQRRACLEQMKITGCNIICLFKDDIPKYILKEHPLHPAYQYLSETQKGDYLKAYFMNFHGGGYADIKRQSGSWIKRFEELEKSDKWIIGYKESGPDAIAGDSFIKSKWAGLIGNGAYICKPHTPLTEEWYSEMIKLLDERLDLLKEYPASYPQDHKNARGPNGISKYPIEWNELNGRIFHRLCATKYMDKLLNTLPVPLFSNYR